MSLFNLFRKRSSESGNSWIRAQQIPGEPFPFGKGAVLKPESETYIAIPQAAVSGGETIGSVILCDDDAEIALNEEKAIWVVKLQPGMSFSLNKSCQLMVLGDDEKPRFFKVKLLPENGSNSNS